jgi:hypothetical protein
MLLQKMFTGVVPWFCEIMPVELAKDFTSSFDG